MQIALRILLLTLLLSACDKNIQMGRESRADGSPLASSASDRGAKGESSGSGMAAGNAYVGSARCGSCHQAEFRSWRYSHHDLAMGEVSPDTVLGNFDDAQFDYFGTTSRFYRKDDKFYVRTDGADGRLHDYPIAYTFGFHPLQQYLIELPGGKLQALSIAWDSRDKAEGGQRWFHLYPGEKIEAGDELHWTGINQNWNFMCADCHSTNLQKNYDLVNQTFDTSWSEIDVGCEACHGPGGEHLRWAAKPDTQLANKGLTADLGAYRRTSWIMDTATGIARRQPVGHPQNEVDTCAQCHSRRTTSFPGARPGDAFLDHFNPALLREGLYHADGQIEGEVYVYGSFLQSKMHAAGVTCSNCHQPHSTKVRAEGNALCAQCHLPARFDTAEHHLHPPASAGAQCVNCHMPEKVYMVVDGRRDHSFRVPRPDLSDKLDSPNACTGCHQDRTNSWATRVLEQHFGKPTPGHYGETIHAGRSGAPGAGALLGKLALDESQPQIARATAAAMLPRYLSRESIQIMQMIAQGEDPLIGLGLAKSLETMPEQIRPALAIPLLYDRSRVTAALAANSMAGIPRDSYPASVQRQFTQALNSYLETEKFNADRPESLTNLAALHAQRGNFKQSQVFFERALSIAPYFTPAYINLADLLRANGREEETEALLRKALDKVSDKAAVQHSLGLSLVRQQRHTEALEFLHLAADAPDSPARYVYVYAIALNSNDQGDAALEVLEQALDRFPNNTQIIQALISLNREKGHQDKVRQYQQLLQSGG